MTLILDLSEELENRLRTATRAEGTDEAETVRHLLERVLPPAQSPPQDAKQPASGEETDAMLLAADLWARSRRGGLPTSDPHALDGDVILAAQMLTSSLDASAMIAATTNPKHLARFVRCAEWTAIAP